MRPSLSSLFNRFIFVFLVCLIAFSSACVELPSKDPNTLYLQLREEPGTLNLLTANDAYAGKALGFVYEDLIDRDPHTLELRPRLAKSWEISPDGLVYTFRLREDVKWQDGKPFTADDVIFSFETIKNDPDAQRFAGYYQDVESIEKLDDYTVRFYYRERYFLALEVCGGIPILPKHRFEPGVSLKDQAFSRHPIGTGPYRFVRWDTGRRIVLSRNEDYWDRKEFPKNKKVVLRLITDDRVPLLLLQKGELDLAQLTPLQWMRLDPNKEEKQSRFVRHHYLAPIYFYVGWNLKRPYFEDKRVRQALTLLVDRQKIIDKVLYGFGKVLSGPFFMNSYAYDTTIAPWPYDPKRAEKLLDEAGWKRNPETGIREKKIGEKTLPFVFTLLLRSGNNTHKIISEIMKEDFASVGIQMNLEILEFATVTEKYQKEQNFDAVFAGWRNSALDPDPYDLWHSSNDQPGQLNAIHFKNAEADTIVETIRRTFDKNERQKLYHRLHAIIHDEQPYLFLYNEEELMIRSRRFKNVKSYPPYGFDYTEWEPDLSQTPSQKDAQ